MGDTSTAITAWGGLAVGILSLIAGVISVIYAIAAANAAKKAEDAADDAKTAAETAQEGLAVLQRDFSAKQEADASIAVYRLGTSLFLQNVTSFPLHNVHYAAAGSAASINDWTGIEETVLPGATATLTGATAADIASSKLTIFWEHRDSEEQTRLGQRRVGEFPVVSVPPLLLHAAGLGQ